MPPKKKAKTEDDEDATKQIVSYLRQRPNVAAEVSTYLTSQQIQKLESDIHYAEQELDQMEAQVRRIDSFSEVEQARRRLGTKRGNLMFQINMVKEYLPKGKKKLERLRKEFNPAGDYFWQSDEFQGGPPPPGGSGIST